MKKLICGIEVDVIKRNVKSVRIKIDRDLNVSLIIPNRCSEEFGVSFFIAKIDWVKGKLASKPKKRQLDFVSGEKVYILGNAYTVKVELSKTNKSFINGEEIVFCANKTDCASLKLQYEKFLKQILNLKVKEYFKKWEEATGLKGKSLTIRKTVSRWGSCNSLTGAINLSLYLACLPSFCLDYVVLHELCHLKYANHGEFFKRELDKYMPNWKKVRDFLKNNANIYLYR
jgi:predicted metal-dependent hydrolase